MVKAMAIIIVLALGGLAVVYFAGGLSSYDPDKQGAEAKAAINPGMTWKQVIDAAGEPGRYQTYVKDVKTVAGEKIEDLRLTNPMQFDRPLFENDIAGKTMPDGFVFNYVFSHQVAFNVHFDANGLAAGIEDQRTAADILGTRK
jgi:hypothetical protein